MTRKDVEQALARGYCYPRNGAKVLDPDLIADMATEVLKLPQCGEQPTVRCEACDGTGKQGVPNQPAGYLTCIACDGTGKVTK